MTPGTAGTDPSGSVRVAVVDSGVNAGHPHVGGVAGGVAFDAQGRPHSDWVDRLGHGTAVAAVIRERAPQAALYAVKIFDRALRTELDALLAALRWCVKQQVHIVNLSLGSTEPAHEPALSAQVAEAVARAVLIVSAVGGPDAPRFLPGALPGVLPVQLDWECPREAVRTGTLPDASGVLRASGYPRPIPGVAPERNLKGLSFAVANVSGLLAGGRAGRGPWSAAEARRLLAERAL